MSTRKLNLGHWCCYLCSALFLVVPACEKSNEPDDDKESVGDAEIGVVRNALSLSELEAVADSTIQSQDPYENNGSSSILEVTAASAYALERTLVRFDQAAIEQAVDGQSVSSATLQVTIDGLSMGWDGSPIAAHRMTMPWTENGVTWACANDTWTGGLGDLYNNCSSSDRWGMDWFSFYPQPYEETPSATAPIHAYQTGTISFDVTTDVQSFLAGANNYGWMIAGTENLWSGLWVDFHSRSTLNPPKLILQYGPELPTASVTVDVTNDTFVSQWFPNRNREGETLLKANSDVSTFIKHALVEFSDYDISAAMAAQGVSSGYELKSAKLIMTVKDPWPFSLMNFGDLVNVHRMVQPWVVDRVTWECAQDTNPDNEFKDCDASDDWDMVAIDPNNRPYLPTATDGQLAQVTYGAEMVWDVTADVTGFRDGTFANYGWLFNKPDDPWLGFISFFSEEGGIPGRLELEFEYHDCTVEQPCESGHGDCGLDEECEPGLVCEFGVEDRFEQPAGVGICWDPECRTDLFTLGCGSLNSPCGYCPCVPHCTDKTCGQDSCGGLCNGLCGTGDVCDYDLDCESGQVCGVFNGPLYGHSETEHACAPTSCYNRYKDPGETDVDCGGDCGSCDQACTGVFCREGEQIPPAPQEVLSFSQGQFTRDSAAPYYRRFGILWAEPDVLRYGEFNDGHGRVAVFEREGVLKYGPGGERMESPGFERAADSLVFSEADVPGWMKTGKWQFDVYPEFSSEQLVGSSEEYVLFSFYSADNRIALRAGPSSQGGGSLVIITGGNIRHERALGWRQNQKLTVTLDVGGNKVTVQGALNNNGEQDVPSSWFNPKPLQFANGPMRIGGLIGGNNEANARISEPRRVSVACVACSPDPNFCTVQCPCAQRQGGCTSDDQCQAGLVCEPNMGERFDLPANFGVCWNPICRDPHHPLAFCGSPDASCGNCPACTPSCADKSCGNDGCWGSCGEQCDQGQAGCNSNLDCAPGLVCGVNNGERFGYAADYRVCWPPVCDQLDQTDIPCGTMSDPCGLCPPCDPIANCAGKECGPDGCGGTCNSTSDDGYCDPAEGRWVERGYTTVNNDEIVFSRMLGVTSSLPPEIDFNYTTSDVGTLPGTFEVSHNGTATYRVPIEVPPGRMEMEPELALVYDSERPNGYLGMGWSLQGLSAITRCNKTFAQDGEVKSLQFDETDRFCVDGQRLVLVNADAGYTYGQAGATYRKEIDDFTKFVQLGGGESGPDSFIAYTRNGLKLSYGGGFYGSVPAISATGREVTHTWPLRYQSDRRGNFIKIEYEISRRDIDSGFTREYYPTQIIYTGFQNQPGHALVELTYEDRHGTDENQDDYYDHQTGFINGSLIQLNKQLTRIRTSVEGRLVREYRLEYDHELYVDPIPDQNGVWRRRTLLSSVSECAQPNVFSDRPDELVCKTPTKFEYFKGYNNDIPSFFYPDYDIDTSGLLVPEEPRYIRLDVNGNGIDDVLIPGRFDKGDFYTWFVLLDNIKWIDTEIRTLVTDKEIENLFAIPIKWALNGTVYGDSFLEYDAAHSDDNIYYRIVYWSPFSNSFQTEETRIKSPTSSYYYEYQIFPGNKDWVHSIGTDYQYDYDTVFDTNGDGLSDIFGCYADASDKSWSYFMGIPTTGFSAAGFAAKKDFLMPDQCSPSIAMDIDGDDGDDLLFRGNFPSVVQNFSYDHMCTRDGYCDIYQTSALLARNWEEDGAIEAEYLGLTQIMGLPMFPFAHYTEYNEEGEVKYEVWDVPEDYEYRATIPMDFSGDGLTDIVQIGPDNKFYFFVNLGVHKYSTATPPNIGTDRGFKQLFSDYLNSRQELDKLGELDPEEVKAAVIDVNGDGREDLLIRSNSDTAEDHHKNWIFLLSTGYGFELSGLWSVLVADPDNQNQPYCHQMAEDIVVYDADGDGRDEIGCMIEGSWRVEDLQNGGAPIGLLRSVTDGRGARVEIDYSLLTNSDVYSHFATGDDCAYPLDCRTPNRAVVANHREWDVLAHGGSVPATRSFIYAYADGRSDSQGRGWLGFGSRIIIQNNRIGSGVRAYTVYSFDNKTRDSLTGTYPFAGLPETETHVTVTDSNRYQMRQTTYEHQYILNAIGAGEKATVFTSEKKRTHTVTEGDFSSDGTGEGEIIQRYTIDFLYDEYGNVTDETTRWWNDYYNTDLLESKLESTIFMHKDNDDYDSEWLLSVPYQTSTTSETPTLLGSMTETRTTRYEYEDMSGLPSTIIIEPDDENYRLTTTLVRDEYGNIIGKSTTGDWPFGSGEQTRVENTTYDTAHHVFPIQTVDPYGHVVDYDYDPGTGDKIGKRSQLNVEDFENYIFEYTVPDGFGRPRYHVSPDGTVTTTLFLEGITDGMPTIMKMVFGSGRPTDVTIYDIKDREWIKQTDVLDGFVIQTNVYDELGRQVGTERPHKMDATPQPTTTTYDTLDRPLIKTRPDSTVERCYVGKTTCTRDSKGYSNCEVKDHRNRVIKVVESDSSTPECLDVANHVETNPSLPGTYYVYGPFENLVATTDQNSNLVVYERDRYGRTTRIDDGDMGERQYSYTTFGENWKYVDTDGRITLFSYDLLGRKRSRQDIDPDGDSSKDLWTTWEYDDGNAYGKISKTISPEGNKTEYRYNQLALVESITKTIDTGDELETFMVGYGYNEHSKRDLEIYPAGPDGDPLGIRFEYKESNGFLEAIVNNTDVNTVYWQANSTDDYGQRNSEQYGNGLVTTRNYNPQRGWLNSLVTTGSEDVQGLFYAHDDNGNVTGELYGYVFDSDLYLISRSFDYDELNRLILENTNSDPEMITRTETYHYDAIGNIDFRTKDLIMQKYLYDSSRPHAVTRTTWQGGAVEEYAYDSNGNMDARGGVDRPNIALEYTRFDKLSSIRNSDDEGDVNFYYDADQKRILKIGQNESTVYFPEMYYRITGTNGGDVVHNYLISNGERVVAQVVMRDGEENDQVYYHHDDELGSSLLITNEDATVEESNYYSAFGELIDYRGQDITNVGYTGHEYDREYSFINMGGRIYDPELGRVLTPDPFIATGGKSPQGFNRYTYVLNNPMRFIDPSGFEPYSTVDQSYDPGGMGTGGGAGTGGSIDDPTDASVVADINQTGDEEYGSNPVTSSKNEGGNLAEPLFIGTPSLIYAAQYSALEKLIGVPLPITQGYRNLWAYWWNKSFSEPMLIQAATMGLGWGASIWLAGSRGALALPTARFLGTATPIAQHANKPWWKLLKPSYSGRMWIASGLDSATYARTFAHESQHLADFARFPGITHLATKPGLFPGRGAARYFLEFRGYQAGGEIPNAGHLGVPLRSLNLGMRLNLTLDLTLFGGGTGAAMYLNQ